MNRGEGGLTFEFTKETCVRNKRIRFYLDRDPSIESEVGEGPPTALGLIACETFPHLEGKATNSNIAGLDNYLIY